MAVKHNMQVHQGSKELEKTAQAGPPSFYDIKISTRKACLKVTAFPTYYRRIDVLCLFSLFSLAMEQALQHISLLGFICIGPPHLNAKALISSSILKCRTQHLSLITS